MAGKVIAAVTALVESETGVRREAEWTIENLAFGFTIGSDSVCDLFIEGSTRCAGASSGSDGPPHTPGAAPAQPGHDEPGPGHSPLANGISNRAAHLSASAYQETGMKRRKTPMGCRSPAYVTWRC